jgi:protease I
MAKHNKKKVAILATDGVEQSELQEPRKALRAADIDTDLVSLRSDDICAWKDDDWGECVKVDLVVSEARAEDYDALVLPGGVKNPDLLRMDPSAVDFVRSFIKSGQPVAASCHGPWMLAEAEALREITVTSYPSIKKDLMNAGARWVDQEVVNERGLITSRRPSNIAAFARALIHEIHGDHRGARSPEQAA